MQKPAWTRLGTNWIDKLDEMSCWAQLLHTLWTLLCILEHDCSLTEHTLKTCYVTLNTHVHSMCMLANTCRARFAEIYHLGSRLSANRNARSWRMEHNPNHWTATLCIEQLLGFYWTDLVHAWSRHPVATLPPQRPHQYIGPNTNPPRLCVVEHISNWIQKGMHELRGACFKKFAHVCFLRASSKQNYMDMNTWTPYERSLTYYTTWLLDLKLHEQHPCLNGLPRNKI